jgi:hypothetical protein
VRVTACVAFAVAASAVLTATAATSPTLSRTPRTLALSATPIEDLRQDGRWFAWRNYCDGQRVTLKSIGRAADVFDFCGIHPIGSEHFALAGGRVLWNISASGNTYYEDVYTAAAGGRKPTLVAEFTSENADSTGTHLGDMAGDGSTLVFSTVVMSPVSGTCDAEGFNCQIAVSGGRVWRIIGRRKVAVRNAPPAWLLAASGGSIALVSATEREGRRTIEVRRVASGRRIARFRTSQPVVALAFSGRLVGALLAPRQQRKRVEVFNTATGRLVRAASISAAVRTISMSGPRMVYRAGRAVRLLHVLTGRNTLLAVTGRGSAPSIEGNRVAWGVRSGRRYAVRAIDL